MPSKSGVGTIAGRALLFASSRPAYICRRCWRQTLDTAFKPNPSLQASLITRRCASSSSLPDRLRKRIWGTDKPPGAEDPYGPPGAFELKRKERETEDRDEGTVQAETRPPQTLRQRIEEESQEGLEDPPDASEATTWEGMPVLGRPDWGKEEWDEEHPFEGSAFTIARLRVNADALL